ncbi:MAG TPA: FAD/NAD(P)-binding protein, partial [Burkholderiaceae bacterium]|nr:FAD/NAD(P)-binding protein [Burkholderiaceae bacterium]
LATSNGHGTSRNLARQGGAVALHRACAARTDQWSATAGPVPSTTARQTARDLGVERVLAGLVLRGARIAIVGMGPRGLTVLERLVANQRVHRASAVEIYVFDPNPPGTGCHDPDQDEHLLVNTVAGQITQFSDSTVTNAGPVLDGPSFHEWLTEESARKGAGTRPHSDSYYSRAAFGRYLHWCYHYLVALAPSNLTITLVRDEVSAMDRVDEAWLLRTDSGKFWVDFVVLTTGHTKPARHSAPAQAGTLVIDDPYPIREQLARISHDMTVGIEGLGLTCMDVIAELTVGRGGRFDVDDAGRRTYIASGREPFIVAYSRSGLPLTARARNQKGVSTQYRPHFLKLDVVRSMRAQRKLDFRADILPLLWADMQYAYYDALLRSKRETLLALLMLNQFIATDSAQQRDELVRQYIPAEDRLDWQGLVNPIPTTALASATAFDTWLRKHIAGDLSEAARGNLDSPIKAACDVVRDVRDNLRAAIDFSGLTEESHRWLMTEFVPFMNRIAVGPPASRNAELLALTDAGVLNIGFGPGARTVKSSDDKWQIVSAHWPQRRTPIDVHIKARVSMHSPADDASTLLQSLLSNGHARLFMNGAFHPGGIEVDRNFNVVSRLGVPISNLWALGIPAEGPKFYTFVVPRTGVNSTALVDAGRVVLALLAQIRGHQAPEAVESDDTSVPTTEYASAFASMYGTL